MAPHSRDLRNARLRLFFEEMSRAMIYALARATRAGITREMLKDDLIDAVADLSTSELRRALPDAVTAPDLRSLCQRLGYASGGSKSTLAARLVAAIEEPSARITRWRSFEAAREFARHLQLRGQAEWVAFTRRRLAGTCELPRDVPIAPHLVYAKQGWTNWGDFLGTDNPARRTVRYRPFAKARAYVRALGLANVAEWRDYCTRRAGNRRVLPPDIPSAPYRIYADRGWISFGDWLGNDHVHASKIEYRSYDEARAFVRALGIRSGPEWRAYCRGALHRSKPRPLDVPTNPQRSYKGRGWVSWGHFFGTYAVALYRRTFRSFNAARTYVRAQCLADSRAWREWCAARKRPPDIPASPDAVYRDRGWTSWPDFLGHTNAAVARTNRRAKTARISGRATRDDPIVRVARSSRAIPAAGR